MIFGRYELRAESVNKKEGLRRHLYLNIFECVGYSDAHSHMEAIRGFSNTHTSRI